MPCEKCENGKYKWGKTGSCKYDTKAECEEANKDYYKKKNTTMKPTPLGKKSFEDYKKELKDFNNSEEYKLSKVYKIKLSRIDDIEDAISRGLGLTEFVEESLDEAFSAFIKAKDIVRFDMSDAYTEGESLLKEFLTDIKELGLDVPQEANQLQKDLDDLSNAIDEAEQKIRDF